MNTTIVIKTQFQGLHQWNDAPEKVAFLRCLHRHIFKVSVEFSVDHDDRDLEYFVCKEKIDQFLNTFYNEYHQEMKSLKYLGSRSCEMICKDISTFCEGEIKKPVSVQVQEDDENYAVLR